MRHTFLAALALTPLVGCSSPPASPPRPPEHTAARTPPSPEDTTVSSQPETPPPSTKRDYAALLERARSATSFEALIHPKLGFFVTHNISGSMPHLDLVSTWPRDEDSLLNVHFDVDIALEAMRTNKDWEPVAHAGDNEDCEPIFMPLTEENDPVIQTLDIHIGARDLGPEGGPPQAPPPMSEPYTEVEGSLGDLASSNAAALPWNADAWTKMQTLHRSIQGSLALPPEVFYVGTIDGDWYVLGVDGVDQHCG